MGLLRVVVAEDSLLLREGISHYDSPPPAQLVDLATLRDADAFRFANMSAQDTSIAVTGRAAAQGRRRVG